MTARLTLGVTIALTAVVAWGTLTGSVASANPLLGIEVDTRCDATQHQVTIFTSDISSPHSIRLIGQILVNQAWTDVGSAVDVTIPTGAKSTFATLSIPLGSASGYRVRVVSSNLDNSSGVVSNTVECAAPTPTPKPTQTPKTTATRPDAGATATPAKTG